MTIYFSVFWNQLPSTNHLLHVNPIISVKEYATTALLALP